MAPLDLSVRADLYRAAQAFLVAGAPSFGVRIEPLPGDRGVLMIAGGAHEIFAVLDPSGHASRAVTLSVSGSMTKLAVDLFRRDGERHRVVARHQASGVDAWLEPGDARTRERNVEIEGPFPEWRGELIAHVHHRLDGPIIADGRAARKISDVAITLGRAAGDPRELYQIQSGNAGALIVTFPAWPQAVALFTPTPAIEDMHATAPHQTWRQPSWLLRTGPALVSASP